MKPVFRGIEDNEELDRLSQEIISDIAKNPVIEIAYIPELCARVCYQKQ